MGVCGAALLVKHQLSSGDLESSQKNSRRKATMALTQKETLASLRERKKERERGETQQRRREWSNHGF